MVRIGAGLCVLACAAAAAPAATAGGVAHSVVGASIADGPAKVRVVVEVSGAALRAREGTVRAVDADPSDGQAVIEIARAGIPRPGTLARGAGVRVTRERVSTGVRLRLLSERRAFKFVSYGSSGSGTRLVIDLWKGTGARRDQQILDDGCLRITRWNPGNGLARLVGLELTPLFEHNVVISVRDARGRRVGLRAVTATGGTFRPDFSGYLRPGRWSGTVSYAVPEPRRGLLEAWSSSARDGALDCLVQVPVVLRPAP